MFVVLYDSFLLFYSLCRIALLKACIYMGDKKPRRATKLLASHLCCIIEVLGNEEKWNTRGLDVGTLAMNETGEATIIDDDASSDEVKKRSSTPHSVPNTRRLVLRKKATKDLKGKKA
jgi:hypothetical protein